MKLALIALFLPALLSGQSEYRGKLAPELAVEAESLDSIDFRLATAQEKERLGEITSRVFAGQIAGAPAFLVDGDKPFLYVEMGSLRKFPLKPERDRHFFGSIPDCAEIRFPLPGPAYKEFPVRVCVPPVQEKTESRTVWQWRTLIAAAVRIGGQDLSFAFEYDRAQNRALPDNGLQMYGVQRMILKDERPVYRSGEPLLFRSVHRHGPPDIYSRRPRRQRLYAVRLSDRRDFCRFRVHRPGGRLPQVVGLQRQAGTPRFLGDLVQTVRRPTSPTART